MNMDKSVAGFDPFENPTAEFPEAYSVGPREWGTEDVGVLVSGKYMMKLIRMKEGAEGGLQYHRLKDEAGFMLCGEMDVHYVNSLGELVVRRVYPGDWFHFPAGAIHKSVAVTACAYIEGSTPHFNDRVHVEGAFGIEEEAGGLPSTHISEIEVR
jgi:quercetin dioxygenase-like cupin family protein